MLSFIIPVYNKGTVLFETLTSLTQRLSEAALSDFEIILVNDGSEDNSFTEALRFKNAYALKEKLKIYHYSQNIGKGFALRFGFYKSCGETIIFLDGDMDINTKQVMLALEMFHHSQADLVIGSKYHPDSRTYYPFNRYIYSVVLRIVNQLLFRLNISDSQVGLKIFHRKVLQEILPRLIIKRFAVDLELLVVAQMLGFQNIVETPVVIQHTSANRSAVNVNAVKNFCQDILAIWYRKHILQYYSLPETKLSLDPFQILFQAA